MQRDRDLFYGDIFFHLLYNKATDFYKTSCIGGLRKERIDITGKCADNRHMQRDREVFIIFRENTIIIGGRND